MIMIVVSRYAIFRYEYDIQVITQDRGGAELDGCDWISYE